MDGHPQVWERLQAQDGLRIDTVAYNSMLSALGKNSEVERALALYEEMQSRGIMLDSMSCEQMISVYQKQVWVPLLPLVVPFLLSYSALLPVYLLQADYLWRPGELGQAEVGRAAQGVDGGAGL